MHRDRIRQVPGNRARLAVAVMDAAVLHRDALDAAGEIGRPGYDIGVAAADALDHRFLGLAEVLVTAVHQCHPLDAARQIGRP